MKTARWIVYSLVLCAACQAGSSPQVSEVGRVRTKSLNEPSGLVMSQAHAGVFWTHNDGDDAVLYAIRSDGSVVGTVKVDEKFKDWEDLASDASGNLYLADCGNNERNRKHMTIYCVAEPAPDSGGKVRASAAWRLSFPDKPFNCESLFIAGEHGYVISKNEDGQPAGIYRFALKTPAAKRGLLEHVVDLPVNQAVTAADLSRDGKQLAVLGQRTLHIFDINGDVKSAGGAMPLKLAVPALPLEGCCFTDDGVLLIAESGEILRATAPAATTQAAP